MSVHQVIAFWKKVEGDQKLQSELARAAEKPMTAAELCAIARANGFDCTEQSICQVEHTLQFLDRVKTDPKLQKQLAPARQIDAQDEAVAEVVRVASSAGLEFEASTLEAVTGTLPLQAGAELDESELHQVVGGSLALRKALTGGFGGEKFKGWSRHAFVY